MRQSIAKLLRKITALTAHTRPGTPRKQYHQLKAAWLATPKNRRGSTSAGLKANVEELSLPWKSDKRLAREAAQASNAARAATWSSTLSAESA